MCKREHEVDATPEAKVFREKAEMFQRRADDAMDPLSEQHYREMAAHYRSLLVEHLDLRHDEPAH